jgi:hypothetical protein
MVMKPEDTRRVHGVNEWLGVENYARIIKYYPLLWERPAGKRPFILLFFP